MPCIRNGLIALLLLACLTPAAAQRRFHSIINISGYVNFVSDYFYRGTSRTNGEQTIQGDAGINANLYGSLRVGFWGSGIVGGSAELRRYVHYSAPVAPLLNLHTGITRYSFPGTRFSNIDVAGAGRNSNEVADGVELDEFYTGFSTSFLLFRLTVTYYEPIENLAGSEAYTLGEIRLPLGVWISRGSNDDIQVGYRFRFNKLALGITIHDNDDSITADEVDNIWRSLRDDTYNESNTGEAIVFNLQANF